MPVQARLDRWFLVILAVVTVPLIVAVFSDAALTWDGANLLFRALDTGVPYIPHDRLIDGPINWPVSWVDALTDSLPVLRATFGVVHVVTPLIALALSWWVVRREAPGLIIWPILGIGLATLPGQINFISEGIKAHQLIWPILLAVLIGLPPRTIPMVAIVSLVIMLLHPAAVLIFGAVAAAAVVIGVMQEGTRDRLYPLAACLGIAALLRFGMITDRYQTGEMNMETMRRQWQNSATGLPGIELALTFAIAAILLGTAQVKTIPRWIRWISPGLVALAGGTLVIWAMQPDLWWDALEFRGPTHIVSLTAAGFAAADAFLAIWRKRSKRLSELSDIRLRAGQAIAVAFAIVLSVQSVAYARVIDGMNEMIAASDATCLSMNDLPNMPETPLNLWPTPSLALLYQGWTPHTLLLQEGGCQIVAEKGVLPLTSLADSYQSDRIDTLPVLWELGGQGNCWWDEVSGWHQVERTETGRRRWSPGTGEIRIFAGEPSTVTFTGEFTTLQVPNSIAVIVNGTQQQTIELSTTHEVSAASLRIQLQHGENRIEFVSANKAAHTAGDLRDLAFSVLNLRPKVAGSSASCELHR